LITKTADQQIYPRHRQLHDPGGKHRCPISPVSRRS
jgi:hypothetical protein